MKVNLANVRTAASVIAPMLAAVAVAPFAPPAYAQADGRAVIAVLPYGTTVEEIAAEGELAPGLVSAGLGQVPVAQTFLDMSQGNRVDEDLYDADLPRLYLSDGRVPEPLWAQVVERAESAPANVVPGLLASTLAEAGVPVSAEADSGLATLIAVDRAGAVPIAERSACRAGCGPGLSVLRARLAELPAIVDRLAPEDLLIAIAAGARAEQELLPTGIFGAGFDGNLTSDSTRTDGLVTTTDIAPTVLDHLGVEVPDEVNGSEITSSGPRDPAAVADLQERLDTRPSRELVALVPLAAWLGLSGVAALMWRRAGARVALRLLGLAAALAPLVLLLAAALDADALAAALLVGLGSVAGALAVDRLAPGCAGFALACGLTVGAYAVDVVVGSPLTSLSVLGPNPGFGVRFFGIGNELEAILSTLTLVGTGAALAARAHVERRTAAAWFVGVAALAAAAFAPGRFGADVGAAIVLGVGAATAAVLALGLQRRRAALIVAGGGALALGAVLVIDLALGGAHLSRSVLGAGEAGEVVDVLERRLTLMTNTFVDPAYPELLAIAVLALGAGFVGHRTVLGWFGGRWAARSGFLGAVAGVLVGTVANDSGSVLLVIGTIYLGISAAFFWAATPAPRVWRDESRGGGGGGAALRPE
jgi:hypothetical protein